MDRMDLSRKRGSELSSKNEEKEREWKADEEAVDAEFEGARPSPPNNMLSVKEGNWALGYSS